MPNICGVARYKLREEAVVRPAATNAAPANDGAVEGVVIARCAGRSAGWPCWRARALGLGRTFISAMAPCSIFCVSSWKGINGFHILALGPAALRAQGNLHRRHASAWALGCWISGTLALVDPVHEALHPGIDNGLGLGHGGLAGWPGRSAPRWPGRPRCTGTRLPSALTSGSMSWHGQVDHEHGAVAAFFQCPLHGTEPDDGQGGCGAAHPGVEFVQALRADRPGA